MAEPSAAELTAFTNLGEIAIWCGVGDDDRDALLTGLGCRHADSFRPIGAMPEADFNAVATALQINGRPPVPFGLSGRKLIGRVSRLAAGTDLARTQIDAAAA